jgi:hypothetical protein
MVLASVSSAVDTPACLLLVLRAEVSLLTLEGFGFGRWPVDNLMILVLNLATANAF